MSVPSINANLMRYDVSGMAKDAVLAAIKHRRVGISAAVIENAPKNQVEERESQIRRANAALLTYFDQLSDQRRFEVFNEAFLGDRNLAPGRDIYLRLINEYGDNLRLTLNKKWKEERRDLEKNASI